MRHEREIAPVFFKENSEISVYKDERDDPEHYQFFPRRSPLGFGVITHERENAPMLFEEDSEISIYKVEGDDPDRYRLLPRRSPLGSGVMMHWQEVLWVLDILRLSLDKTDRRISIYKDDRNRTTTGCRPGVMAYQSRREVLDVLSFSSQEGRMDSTIVARYADSTHDWSVSHMQRAGRTREFDARQYRHPTFLCRVCAFLKHFRAWILVGVRVRSGFFFS